MGSCSSNREEMNETVEGGVEVQNCSEVEKEIGVVGSDPTDDIMIGDIMDGGDDLMFSGEEGLFPSLPDFASLSSPVPSSASINLPQNQSASSSSSSSSSSPWAYVDAPGGPAQGPNMQQQQEGRDMQDQTAVPSAGAAADDIFADFELWDPSNPLDPSFLFADDYDTAIEAPPQHCLGDRFAAAGNGDGDGNSGSNGCSDGNEMGKIFFEWLMNNRDVISVEELRSIRLRRSTIDCAAARLGPGDKGRQELLRLILAWVQNHHLSKIKKRRIEAQDQPPPPEPVPQFCNSHQPQQNQVGPLPSPPPPAYHFPALSDATANPNPNLNYKNCEGGWNMNPVPPVPAMPLLMAPAGEAASMNPYHQYYQSGSTSSIVVSSQPMSSPPDFCSFSPPPPIQYPPFPGLGIPCTNPIPPQYPGGFGSQYPVYLSPALSGAALATKEARKKRMARQRRSSILHQHKHQSHSHRSSSNAAATGGEKANLRVGNEGGGNSLSTHIATNNNVKDWAFWSSGRQRNLPASAASVGSAALLPAKTPNMQQSVLPQPHNGASSDKLQGPKKNLRFLLQKVLKQSDVGSLGRIVLPKKEAEIHLPELDSRDGMSIPMEDIGTSQVWNMKYRFWPNNKSRMYLLENTGDFVRSNGLQEGDFIVIYSDVKRNKYLIRGVKVRQPAEPKEVVAAGISLKLARVHLKNSAGHLNGASIATAVCDTEKNNDNEEDKVLLSYGEEDGGGAPPTMTMVDNI